MNRLTVTMLAVAAASGVAAADTIDLAYLGTGQGRNVRVTLDGNSQNVHAGQLRHGATNGVGNGVELAGQALVTYCADINQLVSSSSTTYELVSVSLLPSPSSETTPTGMGSIRAAAIQSVYAYANDVLGGQHSDLGTSDAFATAFQLVIWELVYDYDGTAGSIDLTSGAFHASRTNGSSLWGDVLTHANDLFLNGVGYNLNAMSVVGLRSGTRQDQLVEMNVPIIPTPTAAALGLVGLGGLAARRRR
ncbi:MAG: hypothetical protein EA378_06230 [Phycisphaerales bacterium]|nr:MAG: hypothetical protein EA378_06230 [Phycisphaerales bacterium]